MKAILETIQIGEYTLTVRDIHASDEVAVLDLHTLVFGVQVDSLWFQWKYGQALSQGKGQAVGAWHGDTLVAFCGGVPQTLLRSGREVRSIQFGDVMVHPAWRGIMTRRGPFFYVSQRLFASRLGLDGAHPFQLGFGFPNQTAMRLDVLTGLAWDGGQMRMLHWKPTPSLSSVTSVLWTWRWQEIVATDNHFDNHIIAAWANMEKESRHFTLSRRDVAYVRWRYADRPPVVGMGLKPQYRYFLLRRPWSRWASGIVIMDLRSPSAHWLNWIGSITLMPLALNFVRYQAAQVDSIEVIAWTSSVIEQMLKNTDITGSEVCSWIGIPVASDLQESDVPTLNWWLMGGDTDFL